MAKVTFSAAVSTTDKKVESKDNAPQAYIFIGKDKFRATDKRTPQDWRKLFICLSRMARGEDGRELSQNEFGLGIVYDALEEMEKDARKALGSKYDATMVEHWNAAQATDAKRAENAAKRAAEASKADDNAVKAALEKSVKQSR